MLVGAGHDVGAAIHDVCDIGNGLPALTVVQHCLGDHVAARGVGLGDVMSCHIM